MSPDQYGDLNPSDLPISQNLKDQLAEWARAFDKTLNMDSPPDSGFESEEAEEKFKREGYRIAEHLKCELGPAFKVTVRI